MEKHFWECDKCGHIPDFRPPELPGDDQRSEQNDDGPKCAVCGGDMYFDTYEDDEQT